jgi:hypothetical protein
MKQLTIILAWLAAAASSWAAQPDYFPLQVGNQWILQTISSSPEILNIEVLRSRTENGQVYFLVSGWAQQNKWLRKTDDGQLLAFDETTGKEALLGDLRLGAAIYRTSLSGCEQDARPFTQTVAHHGSQVDSDGSLVVQYNPNACRDIGFTQEIYAPGIGLARRALTTIRGETVFDLVYARVNGKPVLGRAKELVIYSDFNNGSKGWLAGFADYSLRISDLRMLAELRPLPDEISRARAGFFLQSINRSDDLFMFLKKHLAFEDGVESNQAYRVAFDIRFASNAPTGCVGVGGSPGDSVYLKAGAAIDEPIALLTSGDVHLSADKGQQSTGGRDAGVTGTIANGTPCDSATPPYVRVRREYVHTQPVRTDDRGSMWLLLGTDSGYEGLTGLYIESIVVRINPWVEPAGGSPAR